MHQEKLLREYVKRVLTEDYYGGDGGFSTDYTSGGPMASSMFGSKDQGYQTFIKPFVDLFKVGLAKTKEVAAATKTLLWVALQTVLTTLIPIYGYNYSEVFDEYDEKIDDIKNEYKDVYQNLIDNDVLTGDAAALAFMASPALVTAFLVGKKAPEAIKTTLSAVTGGLSDEVYDSIKEKAKDAERWTLGDSGDYRSKKKSKKVKGSPQDFFGESRTVEDAGKKITPEKILKSNLYLSKVSESPKLKEMQKVAQQTYRETLKKIYQQAEDLLKNANTVEDFERLAKKPVKDIDKVKSLKGEERAKAEKLLIQEVRKSMKEFYVKKLKEQVDSVVRAGIPENCDYVKDFRSTIKKIEAL
jgi:hypothetical protein